MNTGWRNRTLEYFLERVNILMYLKSGLERMNTVWEKSFEKAKELGSGLSQRKDGRYQAKYYIPGSRNPNIYMIEIWQN